jgi:hypothetical protein
MQVVEGLGLGQLAASVTLWVKSVHGSTASIAAYGSIPDSFASTSARPIRLYRHLVVDGLALLLEVLLMLVLGRAEQPDHNSVVQVDQFVRHGGHALDSQCSQCRIAALILELRQVTRRHLRTLARHFQQPILVDLAAKPSGSASD